jgi:hypothetical protein
MEFERWVWWVAEEYDTGLWAWQILAVEEYEIATWEKDRELEPNLPMSKEEWDIGACRSYVMRLGWIEGSLKFGCTRTRTLWGRDK